MREPSKGQEQPLLHGGNCGRGGKLRRFVTQGRTACRNGALIPSRSGYGNEALTIKTMPNINDNFSSCRRDICSRK